MDNAIEFGIAGAMISMIPEEVFLEEAIKALQVYKLAGGEKPKQALMCLIHKWSVEGKDINDILKDAQRVGQIYEVGKKMTDLDDLSN